MMRRKTSNPPPPQDRKINGDHDDSTPSKLRCSPPSSGNNRARFEVDHGSCDWNSSSGANADLNGASSSSSSSGHSHGTGRAISISSNHGHSSRSLGVEASPIPSSPQHSSPSMEGLHHRNTNHRKKSSLPDFPVRGAGAAGGGGGSSNTSFYPTQEQLRTVGSSGGSPRLLEPRPTHSQLLHSRNSKWKGPKSLNNHNNHSRSWKRTVQCLFIMMLLAYCFFLYFAQNHWGKRMEEEEGGRMSAGFAPDHRPRSRNAKTSKFDIDGENESANSRSKLEDRSKKLREAPVGGGSRSRREDDATDAMIQTDNLPPKTLHDYAFKSSAKPGTPHKQPSEPAFRRALEWSHNPPQDAAKTRSQRRKQRRKRTRPPVSKVGAIPLWYKLDHASEGTVASTDRRWNRNVNDDANAVKGKAKKGATDATQLCGPHALEAAKRHPDNYPPSASPLGPDSRVLITGILSPLGLPLAMALGRQCGVGNFMGLDGQFPNEPLSRMEAQERLAILMSELEGLREVRVPFLGLEVKGCGESCDGNDSNDSDSAREEEEGRLAEIRELFRAGNGTAVLHGDKGARRYARPHERYGIPLAPGTDSKGSGALRDVLEYRPTHIVHLAGTQSDSLLASEHHTHRNKRTVFENRDDEEEDVLKASIGSRPHLYELRTGATGMEQLLAGVVAAAMLPGDDERSSDARGERTPPQIVYASSYDALRFQEADRRRNPKPDGAAPDHRRGQGDDTDERDNFHAEPRAPTRPPRGLHGVSRLVDELLSSSYRALHDVTSIGLRFDAIYGPRGFGVPSHSIPIFHEKRRRRRGVSPDVDLAEVAVRGLYQRWRKRKEEKEGISMSLLEESGWMRMAHDRRDFVYVEDAVGAIIAALQYKPVQNSPTTFNIGSDTMSTLSTLADEIQDLAYVSTDGRKEISKKNVIDVDKSSAASAASSSANDYLHWSASTLLKDGAAKLLAWHLDRALPYFPPANPASGEISEEEGEEEEMDYSNSPLDTGGPIISLPMDGEEILKRRGLTSCSHAVGGSEDAFCFEEAHTRYPCASECSTQSCTDSIFDSIIPITHESTEDCDVVMYTMALGYNVEDMVLETQFSDGEDQEEWQENTVCTLAFLPSESSLVKDLIGRVPANSLKERGLTATSDYRMKVELLNGYLSHHGWLLILVDGATKPMSAETMFLPKLTPARLFHSDVRKVMYVDENFGHTPYPDDAQFLTSETSRGVLKERTVKGPDAKGHETKYKLPKEPQRRAVLLVSPMRHIPNVEGHKMPLKQMTRKLLNEVFFEEDEEEPREVKVQREYYENARALINSMDLRSLDTSSWHRLEVKDFIRSRWIIHHLKLEEGHQLRCEWYREHVRWNTHLDQLSFAYIMAKRELARKIITHQPFQTKTEKLTILERVIKEKTDASEWQPIISAKGALPIHHSEISPEAIPLNLQDLPSNDVRSVNPDSIYDNIDSTYYVRIMSDKRMVESRVKWMKFRNARRKHIKRMRQAARGSGE